MHYHYTWWEIKWIFQQHQHPSMHTHSTFTRIPINTHHVYNMSIHHPCSKNIYSPTRIDRIDPAQCIYFFISFLNLPFEDSTEILQIVHHCSLTKNPSAWKIKEILREYIKIMFVLFQHVSLATNRAQPWAKAQNILNTKPGLQVEKNRAHHKYKKNVVITDCLVILYSTWRQPIISIFCLCLWWARFFSACSSGLVYLGPKMVNNLPSRPAIKTINSCTNKPL